LFNDLNYQPRPVFQSYSVFNAELMQLNNRAFASNTAPEFVLFNFDAIDGRFPPLEDAHVLRTLLTDYTLVGGEGPFLLLKHQPVPQPQMTLLKEALARADEPINLSEYGDDDLWMEISLTPSIKGKLRETFYKPPEVYLGVWGQSSARAINLRAPFKMLGAGFVASPVMLRTQDVADLYTGAAIHRPGGYMIRLQPGTEDLWLNEISYRLYRIDQKVGRNSSPVPNPMKLPGS